MQLCAVAPFTGAWIEIRVTVPLVTLSSVAPFTGAWIEIAVKVLSLNLVIASLPSRGRGLKSRGSKVMRAGMTVAPFTGAWIEISLPITPESPTLVAPFTGAWIEISSQNNAYVEFRRRSLHGGVD